MCCRWEILKVHDETQNALLKQRYMTHAIYSLSRSPTAAPFATKQWNDAAAASALLQFMEHSNLLQNIIRAAYAFIIHSLSLALVWCSHRRAALARNIMESKYWIHSTKSKWKHREQKLTFGQIFEFRLERCFCLRCTIPFITSVHLCTSFVSQIDARPGD